MELESGADWDVAMAMAWTRFQRKLGDFIADLPAGETAAIDMALGEDRDDVGVGPGVRLVASDDGSRVRLEVPGNAALAEPFALDEGAVATLVDTLGLVPEAPEGQRPGGYPLSRATFGAASARKGADRLAMLAVRVLRDVFRVPHPALLSGGPLEPPEREEVSQPAPAPIDLGQPLTPRHREDLRDMVAAALATRLGHDPVADDDGDFPIRVGSILVFCRVQHSAPVIELLCPVVVEVGDTERALLEMSILNRRSRFVAFFLTDDTVMARAHIPGLPFVGSMFLEVLDQVISTLDEDDDDLALRIDGRRWSDVYGRAGAGPEVADEDDDLQPAAGAEVAFEPAQAGQDEDLDELPPELQALIELDAGGDTELVPEVVAQLFGWDLHYVLRCIRIAEEQTIAWRDSQQEALETGDEEEAEASGGEMRGWEKTVSDLRAALREIAARGRGEAWEPGA